MIEVHSVFIVSDYVSLAVNQKTLTHAAQDVFGT